MQVKLDVGPLQELVEAAGGPAAAGVGKHGDAALRRSYYRAVRDGQLTLRAADEIAVKVLGRHPSEVWGRAWEDAVVASGGCRVHVRGVAAHSAP